MARKRPEARDRARDDLAGKPPASHLISALHAVAATRLDAASAS
jgi:hypothetical protein